MRFQRYFQQWAVRHLGVARLLGVTIAVSMALLVGAASAADSKRPNIIFLFADDMRGDAVGYHPGSVAITPNLNKLAKRGTNFRNAFVTTSICCVSRATIFSGQWVRRHGIETFQTPFTPEAWQQTYPAKLREAGYHTGFIGKFGVGDAKEIAAMQPHFDYWKGLPGQGGNDFIDPKDPKKQHQTAKFGDQALEFIEGAKADKPFCLSISFTAPHARDRHPVNEFEADPRDLELYAHQDLPRSPLETDEAFRATPPFVQTSEGRPRYERRFSSPELTLRTKRNYYRLITGIDREIGRIVETLQQKGLADNTVIIFTADNGFALGDRGMSDKWYMWEEDIRVPMLIVDLRIPAEKAGREVDAIALNADMAPTILSLAGVKVPEVMQGSNLVPFVQGEKPANWRKDFFYEHHTLEDQLAPSEGIRTESLKYIRWTVPRKEKKGSDARAEELYDLTKDPHEQHNLISDPAYAAQLTTLRKRWEEQAAALK